MTSVDRTQDLREAMVQSLVEGVEQGIELVVLVSDSSSTSSIAPFKARFPDRLVNVGIAEQNLLGVAAGLSLGGYVSVTANAACFLVARSCEQLKTDICYSATNVKLMGLNAGVAYGSLASTHHAIDDISILRSLGTIRIFAPGDGPEAAQVIGQALRTDGPVYVRLDNAQLPVFHDAGYIFRPGRLDILREGGDLTIFALGSVVHEALTAGDMLAKQGLRATVVNMSSVRPTDEKAIRRLGMRDRARRHGGGALGEWRDRFARRGESRRRRLRGALRKAGHPGRPFRQGRPPRGDPESLRDRFLRHRAGRTARAFPGEVT